MRHVHICALTLIVLSARVSTQTAPAASAEAPSIRLGTTIFANYTFQHEPTVADADGNEVHRNAFDLTRAYLNVTATSRASSRSG